MKSHIVAFLLLSPCLLWAETHDPVANTAAVITRGKVRSTRLTPRRVRMEWAENGVFEDRASLTFIKRNLPVPPHHIDQQGDTLVLTTDAITLRYRIDQDSLSPANLRIIFHTGDMEGTWFPGLRNGGNLKGTSRTLDSFDGEISTKDSSRLQLEDGLVSRDGWVFIDDSRRPVFDSLEWPWVTARPNTRHQDFYFICYGTDYRTCLKDFISIAGPITLPPKYAFGYWYSRWRSSSEMEFRELIDTFRIARYSARCPGGRHGLAHHSSSRILHGRETE